MTSHLTLSQGPISRMQAFFFKMALLRNCFSLPCAPQAGRFYNWELNVSFSWLLSASRVLQPDRHPTPYRVRPTLNHALPHAGLPDAPVATDACCPPLAIEAGAGAADAFPFALGALAGNGSGFDLRLSYTSIHLLP